MLRRQVGFTLVEVLVVAGIFSILAGVLLANFGQAGAQSRDTERKADLRALQSAIELYKLKNGRYPAGCNGPGRWSGQVGTSYACPSGSQYIVGLAPEFIPVLPSDSRLNGANSGYVYTTNTDGTVYKLMARLTVESESVSGFDNEFESCDTTVNGIGVCDQISNQIGDGSGNRPTHCSQSSVIFQTSYAVWGGRPFEPRPNNPIRAQEELEKVICIIP